MVEGDEYDTYAVRVHRTWRPLLDALVSAKTWPGLTLKPTREDVIADIALLHLRGLRDGLLRHLQEVNAPDDPPELVGA